MKTFQIIYKITTHCHSPPSLFVLFNCMVIILTLTATNPNPFAAVIPQHTVHCVGCTALFKLLDSCFLWDVLQCCDDPLTKKSQWALCFFHIVFIHGPFPGASHYTFAVCLVHLNVRLFARVWPQGLCISGVKCTLNTSKSNVLYFVRSNPGNSIPYHCQPVLCEITGHPTMRLASDNDYCRQLLLSYCIIQKCVWWWLATMCWYLSFPFPTILITTHFSHR